MKLRWRVVLLVAVLTYVFLWSLQRVVAEESYPPEATRCGKDISTMYSFWQYHIAGTPNPQLTLETGLYTRRDGVIETYAEVLRREAGYETRWC